MSRPFLESVRQCIRLWGYSIATERSYLTWRAVDRHLSVNTQKVVLTALVYLYQKFPGIEVGELPFTLATRQRYLPTVLPPGEVRMILDARCHLHKHR